MIEISAEYTSFINIFHVITLFHEERTITLSALHISIIFYISYLFNKEK